MSDEADRFRRIAARFTETVEAVPPGAWDDPAPCEGWVARDVVRHLVEWVPAFFFERWGIAPSPPPSVDTDPVKAWAWLADVLQASLDDPAIAAAERETQIGTSAFAAALDRICTNDILIHTWDLARAAGVDERLDPDEVHRLYVAMEPLDDVLRASGQYGPRVEVPDEADEQTKLIAFTGRRP